MTSTRSWGSSSACGPSTPAVPGGRAQVEARAARPEAFLLSALLVTLWHLQWYLPGPFRGKHVTTKDDLVSRLLD